LEGGQVDRTERITPPAQAPGSARSSSLTIGLGNRTYVFGESQAPIVIGRDETADVRIDDEHISLKHLRVEHTAEGWAALDYSLNGTFVRGERSPHIVVKGSTTINLGHADGIALVLSEDAPQRRHPLGPVPDGDDDEVTAGSKPTDPDVARAGAAVAARRTELDLSQRALASTGVMSAGTLIDFEKGRRWPRAATRTKLEAALNWPQGHIASIRRHQDFVEDDRETVELTNAMRVPMMTQVMEVALSNIGSTIDALPAPSDPDFTTRATRVLADLRTLEASAAGAARAATGNSSMAKILGGIRKTYRELMLRAARAPGATLGQRLFAARHRNELSIEELANAAGVPVGAIRAAEAEAGLDASTVAALTTVLSKLKTI
jgi:transcriptional regulator with XRE-family HTH domain